MWLDSRHCGCSWSSLSQHHHLNRSPTDQDWRRVQSNMLGTHFDSFYIIWYWISLNESSFLVFVLVYSKVSKCGILPIKNHTNAISKSFFRGFTEMCFYTAFMMVGICCFGKEVGVIPWREVCSSGGGGVMCLSIRVDHLNIVIWTLSLIVSYWVHLFIDYITVTNSTQYNMHISRW